MHHRPLIALLAATAVLTGCTAAGPGETTDARQSTSAATAADLPAPVLELAQQHGSSATDIAELVQDLDRSPAARPLPFGASVRPDEVLFSLGGEEVSVPMPEDSFYLSVAPYVQDTHECFFHNLATCQGELVNQELTVTVHDDSGGVILQQVVTTGSNGFAGFWLPRDITGTLEVSHDGRTGAVDFGTGPEDPTCLTTLRLSA